MRFSTASFFCCFLLCSAVLSISDSYAQGTRQEPPKVFLDKSPRIVAYQLKRLSDDRLLLVPRSDDDKKYIPVHEAIVSRPGMAANVREESIAALAKLRGVTQAAEILAAISDAKPEDIESKRHVSVLTRLLLSQPTEQVVELQGDLEEAAESDEGWLRSIGYAGLITAGAFEDAKQLASDAEDGTAALLGSVDSLPHPEAKNSLRDFAIESLESRGSKTIVAAAIEALSKIPAERVDTYRRLIALVEDPKYRIDACRALLRLPARIYEKDSCDKAAQSLVAFAEATEPANRTTDAFIDAMQLVDRLMTKLPGNTAKAYRARLREITVRVVKIKTVEEEMRYDLPYFAVEAGRSVQILLENHDLMGHNLVITTPGSLKAVALGGLAAGPTGTNGLPYVPDSPHVIAASEMIAPDKVTRMTLTAPTEPGEYPYVCTFPQHWYRMYGVMVVVEDLDAWNADPVEPENPIGSNRSFVQAWKLSDFEGQFENGLRGRSPEIGEKIFNEASCAGCHKVKGVGGMVGPELTDLYTRWKGDDMGILREILEPSHKIDAKYATQKILTVEGKVILGILAAEDDDKVTLVSDPTAKEPIVVLQDDIEDMVRSSTSMMPKALMDQFNKDEVLELMMYLKSLPE